MSAYPERIVCLTEETTETLYLLGQGDRVVGVSGDTVRPPEARRKPRIFEVKSTYILQPGPASLTEGVRQLHALLAALHEIEVDPSLAPVESVDRLCASLWKGGQGRVRRRTRPARAWEAVPPRTRRPGAAGRPAGRARRSRASGR